MHSSLSADQVGRWRKNKIAVRELITATSFEHDSRIVVIEIFVIVETMQEQPKLRTLIIMLDPWNYITLAEEDWKEITGVVLVNSSREVLVLAKYAWRSAKVPPKLIT